MQRENEKRAEEKRTQQKPRKKRKNPFTRQEKELMAAAIVLALALVGLVGYKTLFARPDLGGPDDGVGTEQTPGGEENPDEIPDLVPRDDSERKSEDYYTILILGRDTGGGGNTDTILLASYNVTKQEATVMSIPRDTMVNVSWDVKKINSVYSGYGGGDNGINAVYREVSQLVGFKPDFQVVVEWDAVEKIVDAVGGVYFDVPYDMDYHDPQQDLSIEQKKGYRLLSGSDAMQVIRWRQNDEYSPYGHIKVGDSGRMEIQQNFLKAMIQQVMQPANVLKIGELVQVFQECVQTDLTLQETLWFGKAVVSGGLDVSDVEFVTMPYTAAEVWSRTYNQRLDYLLPRATELLTMVNEKISPFAEPFRLDDLDIMYVNYDGSVSSTSGHVEDADAAKPPVIPPEAPVQSDPAVETPVTPEPGTEISGEGTEGSGTETPGAADLVTPPAAGGEDAPIYPETVVPDEPIVPDVDEPIAPGTDEPAEPAAPGEGTTEAVAP